MKYNKLVLLVVIFTMVFSGCRGTQPTQTTDVCVLLGDFSNAKDADLSVISECIDPTVNNKVNFIICTLDGEPEDTVLTSKYNNGNRTSVDMIHDHYNKFIKNDLILKTIYAVPQQKETDILSGLVMAEKYLSNSKADFKKVIIFSTGISTSGYVNLADDSGIMAQNDESIDSLIRELKEKNYLPDLSGIEIYWYNMCETKMPQITPSRANRVKIENLWKKILQNCGVEESNINFDYSILDSADSNEAVSYPLVTPVLFEDEDCIWSFPNETVQFNPNEATFSNEEAVHLTLKPYAQKICNTASKKFIIVGSTATYGEQKDCLSLSLERAEAVKKVFCEYGVSPDCLLTYGVGQKEVGDNLTERADDIIDGKFVEKQGELNRKVMVVDLSTTLGQQLLNELKE